MHDFKHSFGHRGRLWLVALGILILVILGAHLFGINFLIQSGFSSSGYLWPVLLGVSAFAAWHLWKVYSSKVHRTHSDENVDEVEIVSRNGLHWHPEVAIYVKGEKQEIPHSGLSDMDMGAMHKMRMRHGHQGPNEQGIIHLKFEGLVRKSDITLGRLFEKWGKDIRSLGSNVKMTVNGRENTEYENYVMQDKDKIELHYE